MIDLRPCCTSAMGISARDRIQQFQAAAASSACLPPAVTCRLTHAACHRFQDTGLYVAWKQGLQLLLAMLFSPTGLAHSSLLQPGGSKSQRDIAKGYRALAATVTAEFHRSSEHLPPQDVLAYTGFQLLLHQQVCHSVNPDLSLGSSVLQDHSYTQ